MSIIKKTLKHRRFQQFAIVATLLGILGAVVAWQLGLDAATLKSLWRDTEIYLRENPWALFLAIVFLPALPFPVSALLVAAGIVWRDNLLAACALALLALALNMTWTYWLAAYPGRRFVEKLISATSMRFPDLPHRDHVRLILILRLTPGIPLFVHNYVLGFLRTPFLYYLPLSLLLAGPIACGILITGGALFEGRVGLAFAGACLLIVGILVTKMLRTRLALKRAAEKEVEPDPAAEI